MLLLALLTRNVRIAAIVRAWPPRGQSARQIAAPVRPVPVPVIEAMMARVAGVSRATLADAARAVLAGGVAVQVGWEPRAELTALVAELCAAR